MEPEVKGLHHITVICGDPEENAEFYVNTLGLRMVKKTVNHDAPGIYHLYYADAQGTPGSSITFFPEMSERQGETGAGQVSELGLRIPPGSLEYWKERLEEEVVEFTKEEYLGTETLRFKDPHGLQLRLQPEESDDFEPWDNSDVPEKHQIMGMSHIAMAVENREGSARLLEEMKLDRERNVFEAEDGSRVVLEETSKGGTQGTGSVHHIAFKVEDTEEQQMWREKLQGMGMRPSPLVDRKYFSSIYFREPGGVLYEFATMGPGYTADESVENLGSSLVLPEDLEARREKIEESLPRFEPDLR